MSKLNRKKALKRSFLTPVLFTATIAASTFLVSYANAETKVNGEGDRLAKESETVHSVNADSLVEKSQLRSSAISQNVTSVSQLSDVKSTDWAFTALQSLVERYGVIAGYPDLTFRGKQALSRYEFAAGLNSALDKINEIISAGLADKVSKEDLATLQKLQEEFAAELATLRGRVDALDAKTAKLEAQQFSTTTRLVGEAIFGVAAASDGNAIAPGSDKTNTTFSYRARLNFDTSFTGKDLLRTRLQASNTQGNLLPDALGSGSGTRLSFDTGGTANQFEINRLWYRFPIGDNFKAYIGAVGQTEDVIEPLNPLASDGQGTISRFGRLSPLLRIGSGAAAGGGSVAVLGFDWQLSPQGNLQVVYSANNAASATPGSPGGLFGGSTVAAAQLVWKPSDALKLGVGYANSYHQTASLNSGLNQESITTILPNVITGTRANTIVGSLVWDITKKITFNTWGSYIFADAVGSVGSTTFTSWSTALSFKDIFSEGDLAAVIFGQPLYKNSASNGATKVESPDTPYHLEALYRFRISKNISITPGVYFVFNANSNSTNGTATVGVIRTTFNF